MRTNYKLFENVKIKKSNSPYNVYITKEKIYIIKLDKYTPELRKLNRTYSIVNGIGIRFGLVGALLVTIPLELIVTPKINKERQNALSLLRNIDGNELDTLEGYKCNKHEVVFEERKKDRYRIHMGKDWLTLDGQNARELQSAL